MFGSGGTLEDLISGSYTFVNADLAGHYGMSGDFMDSFERVDRPGGAGVLTQAGFLAPSDKPTRTSIVNRGKKIRTAESLGGKNPDAVPVAFVDQDAEQCGFCTPGFVVAVRAFLDKNPKATEQQIQQGLNGNICRCGTYANIVQAVIQVVKGG